MASAAWIAALLLSATITGFHSCAIYVCVTSIELKKVRFLRLALFLSLSDCAMGVEYLYASAINLLNTGHPAYKFQCMLIKHIVSGTLLSSLLHTLLICLERLNATFTSRNRILNNLTGNVSVGLCFAIPHCFPLTRFVREVLHGQIKCEVRRTVDPVVLYTVDLPVALLIVQITAVYGVVIFRMIKQQKTIGGQISNITENQIAMKKKAALRLRRSTATLGGIVVVAIISTLPRAALGIYAYVQGINDTVVSILAVANNVFLLLNPLLDPIIYIFRIQKYREKLMCKVCLRSKAITNSNV